MLLDHYKKQKKTIQQQQQQKITKMNGIIDSTLTTLSLQLLFL